MVMRLECATHALVIDDDEWATVTLWEKNKEQELGAEDRGVIIEKLREGLQRNEIDEPVGKIYGVPVGWVLHLEERHASFYLGIENAKRHLFIQDSEAQLLAEIILDREHVRDWLRTLGNASASH